MRSSKGFFFTVGVIVLLIPLLLLVSYYLSLEKTKTEDVTGKIRCDELHYIVEDLQKDLSRATSIFGRRAAVYAVDYVVSSGNPLGAYAFNCTGACGVNCGEFSVGVNGSEAAVTELVLCGTLFGGNATYMVNHTLSEWVDRITADATSMAFNTSITVNEILVIPYDAYSFSLILNLSFEISDLNGLCYYQKNGITTQSVSSITGLEDPLYALRTGGDIIKYITNCSIPLNISNLAGSSDRGYGNGSGGGNILFATDIPNPERDTYCTTHNVSGLILVMPQGFGACNQIEQACFNASAPSGHHFEGVINYGPDDPQSFSEKCNITIPWISDTDDLGLSEGECAFIKNVIPCALHDVYESMNSNETNTTCYQVSDISPYLTGCESLANGPSFFDRLDGSLNLSEKYVNQSLFHYGKDDIGLETLVNPYELSAYGKTVYPEASWIDYLFWQNISGCPIPGLCQVGQHHFTLDCPHTKYFQMDSSCVNGSGVPPSSQILSPTEGESLDCSTAPFTVSGNASDCDGSVSYVSVLLGGLPWVNATYSDPSWNLSWTPTTNGSYTLIAKATDDWGLTESPASNVSVSVYDCGETSSTTTTVTVTCNQYCILLGPYASGACRKDAAECATYGEVHEAGGDALCVGGPQSDTCCCLPGETSTTSTTTTSTSTTSTTTSSTTSTTTSTTTTTTSTSTSTTTFSMAVFASDNLESGGWSGGSGWSAAWSHTGDSSVTSSGSPHGGSRHLRLRRGTGYASRPVDLSGKSSAYLRFWAKANSFEPSETAKALVSPNGGGNWYTLKTWFDGEDDNTYHYYEYDLSPYGLTPNFIVAYDADMSWTNDYFYVDDVEIYGG